MKRSDAIRKLQCTLWGKNIPLEVTELAELVLNLAEEVGMLPPDSLPNFLSLGEQATIQAVRTKKRYKWEEE